MNSEQDTFFTREGCDRCKGDTNTGFIMSWFTDEKICMGCSRKEDKIKSRLFMNGLFYEGCGYIPNPKTETAIPITRAEKSNESVTTK